MPSPAGILKFELKAHQDMSLLVLWGVDTIQEEGVLVIWQEYRSFAGEGNGNPFQYSCLETPMDRGAW